MKKVAVASNNKHKIEEIRAILSGIYGDEIEVKSLSEIGFSGDIVEDGDTFEANAEIKARAAAKLGYIAIADDSGLCVDALDGAPGIYSARFAGEPSDDKKNNDKLLDMMKDIPEEGRGAKFVSVICCVTPEGEVVYAANTRDIGDDLCRIDVTGTFLVSGYVDDNGFFLLNGNRYLGLSKEVAVRSRELMVNIIITDIRTAPASAAVEPLEVTPNASEDTESVQ